MTWHSYVIFQGTAGSGYVVEILRLETDKDDKGIGPCSSLTAEHVEKHLAEDFDAGRILGIRRQHGSQHPGSGPD